MSDGADMKNLKGQRGHRAKYYLALRNIARFFGRKKDVKAVGEEVKTPDKVLAQKPEHLVILVVVQAVIIILFAVFVVHEKFPKDPDILPYPGVGEPGGPIFQEAEPVIPFKRYSPGYDIVGPQPDGTRNERLQERTLQRQYKYQLEIVTYVYLGFGMQYSFLRKFGFSTLAFGLMAASIASQWGMVWLQLIDRTHCQWLISSVCDEPNCRGDPDCGQLLLADQIDGTFEQIRMRQACVCDTYLKFAQGRVDFENTIVINSPAIIEGLYATVPVQITMGMLLGKVSLAQLSAVSMVCVTSYGLNYWIITYMLGCYDNVGGSCIIHLFGACFGAGCTLLASLKGSAENPDNAPRYNADVMAIIGTILNWMTFPTFNAYFAPAGAQQAVVVNTYLSLFSSCIASLIFSSLYSGQFKLDPADVQRSSLAGGVAISSVR